MKELANMTAEAASAREPRLVTSLPVRPGGVDPLGLRQINFNLMDRLLPGLNNVARHIRPLTVMGWAWRRAWKCAEQTGQSEVPVDMLRDVVDRIEVIYVWSQLLLGEVVDLPGIDYLGQRLPQVAFTFGGADWTEMRKARRESTALSAAVNYGPSLRNFGFVRAGEKPGVLRPEPRADQALNVLDTALGEDVSHTAFSKAGTVEVTRNELKRWGERWQLLAPSEAEQALVRNALSGTVANAERRLGVRLIQEVAFRNRSHDEQEMRKRMCDGEALSDNPELQQAAQCWLGIQTRQLFRLALESLLQWAMIRLSSGPRMIEALASDFVAATPSYPVAKDWLSPRGGERTVTIVDRLHELEGVLHSRPTHPELAFATWQALCTALAAQATDATERTDRLPLARAQSDVAAFEAETPVALMMHVLGSWVFGQHVMWSVGRGFADARNRISNRILRLKVVQDEVGWRIVPGAALSPPRPTADRLYTALTLMREAGMIGPLGTRELLSNSSLN